MKLKALMLVGVPLMATVVFATNEVPKSTAKPIDSPFYVYKDRGDRANHSIPSGWMGNNPSGLTKSLKFNPAYVVDQNKKDYCIKITYLNTDPEQSWVGIYWQSVANGWGDKKFGYDLSGFKKFSFKARGEKGGEIIDFFIGGIKGSTEQGDSDEARLDGTELTKEWKTYAIDLKGLDLSHIIGPFGWATNLDTNSDGVVFYIDEIRYEK